MKISPPAPHSYNSQILRLLTLIACTFFGACATTTITPRAGQNTFFSGGAGGVASKGKQTGVIVLPQGKNQKGRLEFIVLVHNFSKQPFNFGTENIRAEDQKNRAVKIYSREKLEAEARADAALLAFAIGMNAASQSFQAAQPTQTFYSGGYSGTANYNVYGKNNGYLGNIAGTQTGSTVGVATTYNPAATAAANAQIQGNMIQQMEMVQTAKANNLAAVRQILATTTVYPTGEYAGRLVVNKAKEVKFTIEAGGEMHTSVFDVSP